MKWFKQLDHWTDRRPVAAFLLICCICLLGATMVLHWREDTLLTVSQAWFVSGFLAGLVFGALLTSIDIIRKGPR